MLRLRGGRPLSSPSWGCDASSSRTRRTPSSAWRATTPTSPSSTSSGRKCERNRSLREAKEDELEGIASEMGESPDFRLRDLENRTSTAKATEDRLRQLSDAEVEQRRRAAAATADRLTHQIGEHRELVAKGLTVCPKCGQPIDPAAIEKDLAQWAAELEAAKKQQAAAVD